MSFPPSNDASMMPSPRRGKRNPRFSSPGQQFSPGGQQNSFHQSPYNNRGGQQSPYNNRGGQQSPYNNRGFGYVTTFVWLEMSGCMCVKYFDLKP